MTHLLRRAFIAVAFAFSGMLTAASTTMVRQTPAPVLTEGVTIKRDVAYLSPEREEKLDLYLPARRPAGKRSPGVVIIHGGGWTGGSKGASREINIGTTLAKAGYVCASVDYRLTAQDRWPTNLFDCKNAVRFLRKNADKYGIDTDHIGVIGGSAGGHLALMVAYTDNVPALEPPAPYPGISNRVQAVVDLYGITDLRTRQKTDAEGNPTGVPASGDALFGEHKPITAADYALGSPVEHLTPRIPPTLILHGTHDTTVDREQSITLAKRLAKQKLPHQIILIPSIGHTFDLQTWNRKPLPMDLRPTVTGFFDRYLRPAAKTTNPQFGESKGLITRTQQVREVD